MRRDAPRMALHAARSAPCSARSALGLIAAISAGAAAAGDAKRGAQLFQQCMACHSVQPGEHMTGPSLAHAAGRKAGTGPGFQRYSEALKRSGVTWNDAALERARI